MGENRRNGGKLSHSLNEGGGCEQEFSPAEIHGTGGTREVSETFMYRMNFTYFFY
jgi:hypothetical protein